MLWELATHIVTAIGACASVCIIWEFVRRHDAKRKRVADEMGILHIADHVIRHHGNHALHYSAMHAFALFDKGDVVGFHTWKQIAELIDERRR